MTALVIAVLVLFGFWAMWHTRLQTPAAAEAIAQYREGEQ